MFYAGSDYADDKRDRKSRPGWVSYTDAMSYLWNSHKQKSASRFTAEAKYIALSECASDVKWILNYTEEIGIPNMF